MTQSSMPEDCPHLTIYFDGDVTVAELVDLRLADPDIIAFQERILLILADHAHPKVVLDLCHVTAVSSAMVASLLRLRKKVADKLGRLALCCVQPSLMNVLQFIRLTEIFKVQPSSREAVEVVRTPIRAEAPAEIAGGARRPPGSPTESPQAPRQEEETTVAQGDEKGDEKR